MTTKRMKKLLMGMGLSRNQATRMIQEQRTEGSKDVSNALYFHVFQKDFNLIVSSCGGEVRGAAGRRTDCPTLTAAASAPPPFAEYCSAKEAFSIRQAFFVAYTC